VREKEEFEAVLGIISEIKNYKSQKSISLGEEIPEFQTESFLPKQYIDFVKKVMRVKKITAI